MDDNESVVLLDDVQINPSYYEANENETDVSDSDLSESTHLLTVPDLDDILAYPPLVVEPINVRGLLACTEPHAHKPWHVCRYQQRRQAAMDRIQYEVMYGMQ